MTEQLTTMAAHSANNRLAWQIAVGTLGRFCINTSRRFVYPFAPIFSRSLGVPLPAITSLIAINQATGLLSPLFGPLGDRWGYRIMMLIGLIMLAIGMIAGGLLPFYMVLLIALLLGGLGKSIFDPALQAYVGEKVPYHRRGLVIGIIELSWSASSLVGIPVAGLLIDRMGWQSPFLVLGGLSLLSAIALAVFIPPNKDGRPSSEHSANFKANWRLLSQQKAAWGGLGFAFFTSLSNDNLFVVYGAWLENSFTLSIVALGMATTVIGIAELLGEGLTATIADRLGLKRAIIIGLAMSVVSYAILPVIGQTLPLALFGLFLIFLAYEFSMVTSFPLFTEVLPRARGTMMSSFIAAAGIGRVIGALMGGAIWLAGGIGAISVVSAIMNGLALVCFWWGLAHWEERKDKS